jgi:hypothetical protein
VTRNVPLRNRKGGRRDRSSQRFARRSAETTAGADCRRRWRPESDSPPRGDSTSTSPLARGSTLLAGLRLHWRVTAINYKFYHNHFSNTLIGVNHPHDLFTRPPGTTAGLNVLPSARQHTSVTRALGSRSLRATLLERLFESRSRSDPAAAPTVHRRLPYRLVHRAACPRSCRSAILPAGGQRARLFNANGSVLASPEQGIMKSLSRQFSHSTRSLIKDGKSALHFLRKLVSGFR